MPSETLEEPEAGGGSAVPAHQHLFIALECDRPLAGGARHSLIDVDEVVIVRGVERNAHRDVVGAARRLVLSVPGSRLSATHCRIVSEGDGWVLEDASSRNGTFANGERIDRAALEDGDVFDAGRTLFVFRDAVPTPPGTPRDVDSGSFGEDPPGLATLLPDEAARVAAFERIARSALPVLLLGETGTGKELHARAAHQMSGRRGPFVPVNCGALAPSLIESQLFGHVRGAFSGALRDEPGFVRAAEGGTLFLDEVGDLPLAAQAALLRVLQEREVVPVGSTRALQVDVRFVAATHRPLPERVEAGTFRRDLLARLDGYAHALAPLRERREDIGLLVRSLLDRGGGSHGVTLSIEAGRALLRHDWPANVRELEQCLARAVTLAQGGVIEPGHLPVAIGGSRARREGVGAVKLSKEEAELRATLAAALREHGGNVSEVARAMGKAPMQIYRWMRKLGITPKTFR